MDGVEALEAGGNDSSDCSMNVCLHAWLAISNGRFCGSSVSGDAAGVDVFTRSHVVESHVVMPWRSDLVDRLISELTEISSLQFESAASVIWCGIR